MTAMSAARVLPVTPVVPHDAESAAWITRLTTPGHDRDDALRRLHDLMLRAAHFHVSQMSEASRWGHARREEIVQAAADEATMSVLARLDSFEGRSRFTTWAYKFAILQAAVEVRRSTWRSREIDLHAIREPVSTLLSPERYAEAGALAEAVRRGLTTALTAHQRRVMTALVIDEIPIDVLAERLGTTRNALYKTLHDARKRLRDILVAQGLLEPTRPETAQPKAARPRTARPKKTKP
jgi:RNA polymerase sigma-70 factor, ECF subfamily